MDMNKHGQQLFFVGLFWRKRQPPARSRPPALTVHQYPVAHEQLRLIELPRDLTRIPAQIIPPDPGFALVLDTSARDHALAHGWSKTRLTTALRGLRILAWAQDTPGSPIKATEVANLDPSFSRQPILDVLEGSGLLQDDREPAIVPWFTQLTAGLPEAIAEELGVWFDVMLHGNSTAPRTRPRAHVTIRVRVRAALPAVNAWVSEGCHTLRQVSRDDIKNALPAQGSDRALAGTALRSLFRTLKAKRVVFTNPTTHLHTGRPETRIPLPINDLTMRAALESDDPARAALAALIGFHALRSQQVRGLLLTDIRDGRVHLPGRTVPLAPHARHSLSRWLDYRAGRWPETPNPHLFITKQSAVRTTQVSHVWVNNTLGISAQAIREDRILHEARATGDIRQLCDLFGLSVKGAERYLTPFHGSPQNTAT
jgi:site-specific recombinase XerC